MFYKNNGRIRISPGGKDGMQLLCDLYNGYAVVLKRLMFMYQLLNEQIQAFVNVFCRWWINEEYGIIVIILKSSSTHLSTSREFSKLRDW